jgi:methylenetetrahydrofolate--tRNA-(uracil-5-)-methyltransferase
VSPSPEHPEHEKVTVIGGGLAGCEAAWQLATRGVAVRLVEMRPVVSSPAHHSADLGELVCSNSLKSENPGSAAGLLKSELAAMGSIVLQVASETRVPAGGALAVDRTHFARSLTARIESHPGIEVVRREATAIPAGRVIVATGPLTSPSFEAVLGKLVGAERLAFFDAAAPIVEAESLDRSVVFAQSRYDKGETPDYLNAPMSREQYEAFHDALVGAKRVTEKEFEHSDLFRACQPVEEVARSGRDSLRFGAMKPVGLTDPVTGSRPWAVVQLRAENRQGSAYNLVGFQTNLTFGDQDRVFRLIPGLQGAVFLRHGVMHRNTFVDAPRVLDHTLAVRSEPRVRLAGQVTGTEGYCEAAASGLVAALNTYADIARVPAARLPLATALGALLAYATDPETGHYEPMHVNFGLVPPLPVPVRGKRDRYAAYAERAKREMDEWLAERDDLLGPGMSRG